MKQAIVFACVLLLLPAARLSAHGGEDHSHAEQADKSTAVSAVPAAAGSSAPPAGDRPQRLADGRVFLPKPSQRHLQVRTQIAQLQRLPLTLQLNAHVITDPTRGGRVQAGISGRLLPGPDGLPLPGQKVHQGQVLARIETQLSSPERAARQAQLAQLRQQLALAEQGLQRLRELEGSVARKQIIAAELEVSGLQQQMQALRHESLKPQELRAPVSGVIASANAIHGQIVNSGDILFEISDPASLLIEALVYDPAQAGQIVSASINGSPLALQWLGSGGALRAGALPVLFRTRSANPGLALGQSLTLTAQMRQQVEGVALPASALVKTAANQNAVWLHEQAEYFRLQVVQQQPLDGERIVAQGLRPGQRVVITGAALINQIR